MSSECSVLRCCANAIVATYCSSQHIEVWNMGRVEHDDSRRVFASSA